jgi:hypothetical protein
MIIRVVAMINSHPGADPSIGIALSGTLSEADFHGEIILESAARPEIDQFSAVRVGLGDICAN